MLGVECADDNSMKRNDSEKADVMTEEMTMEKQPHPKSKRDRFMTLENVDQHGLVKRRGWGLQF